MGNDRQNGDIIMIKFNFKAIQVHGGIFHVDDLFCVYMAKKILPDIQVIRGGKPLVEDKEVLVADYGNTEFDHHDTETAVYRSNGVRMSASGLMFREWGSLLIPDERVRNEFELEVIYGIDAVDNGQDLIDNFGSKLGAVIKIFNPLWGFEETADEQFNKALGLLEIIIERKIDSFVSKVTALETIESKDLSTDIVEFERFVPAKEYLCRNTNVKFLIYPSLRGGYNLDCVPPTMEEFQKQRVKIPVSGKEAVEGVTFVHPAGFLAACETIESARKLAEYSMAQA